VEWERKSDETKGKTERKEGNREDIHRMTLQNKNKKKQRTFAKKEKREG
jgi:hypothetical protein